MNFATTLLLCLVCSVFAFKVTKDRRSLTDMVSMGRKYRRHSKEVEATALELVVTESGNTALKLDAKGSKDYDALQKDDGTVVWGSAELIVYTCLGDAYNVRVACFNRA